MPTPGLEVEFTPWLSGNKLRATHVTLRGAKPFSPHAFALTAVAEQQQQHKYQQPFQPRLNIGAKPFEPREQQLWQPFQPAESIFPANLFDVAAAPTVAASAAAAAAANIERRHDGCDTEKRGGGSGTRIEALQNVAREPTNAPPPGASSSSASCAVAAAAAAQRSVVKVRDLATNQLLEFLHARFGVSRSVAVKESFTHFAVDGVAFAETPIDYFCIAAARRFTLAASDLEALRFAHAALKEVDFELAE
jgi:hypothetical protein